MALAPLKPYVNSPGINPTAATTYTTAAASFYPKKTAAPTLPTIQGAGTSTQPTVKNPVSQDDFYNQQLAGDQTLQAALAGVNASGVAAKAQLTAGLQRGVIGFGAVPQSALAAPGVGDAIDQTTRDLAAQNTASGLSTTARLKQAYAQTDQAHVADEAARGILRSGAYGQHAAEDLLGYNQQTDDATQQLMDYLRGLYSGYLSQQDTLRQQAYQYTNDAQNRIIAQINAGQLTYPATYDNPDYYNTQQLAQFGSPSYAGAVQFSPDDVTRLAHAFGSLTPEQLQQLGVGTAAPAAPPVAPPAASPSTGRGTRKAAG